MLANSEIEKIENSSNPRISIHVLIFTRYKEFGYDKTQERIRQILKSGKTNGFLTVQNYLNERVNKNEQFEPYKSKLLGITLSLNAKLLEKWAYTLKKNNFSKQYIFEILSELFVFIKNRVDLVEKQEAKKTNLFLLQALLDSL